MEQRLPPRLERADRSPYIPIRHSFYLESPLDTWAAYDAKCSHYAVRPMLSPGSSALSCVIPQGPVMQEVPGPEPSERSVMCVMFVVSCARVTDNRSRPFLASVTSSRW